MLIQQPCSPCVESMISMDGEIFLMPQSHNDSKRKFISDDKTYLLALDGDTDFQPKAIILLVDRSVSLLNNLPFFILSWSRKKSSRIEFIKLRFP